MKKLTFIITVFLIVSFGLQAQFIQNTSRSLFSDVKAFKKGDAVTILIVEYTQADNSATTKDSRSTTIGGGVDANFNSSRFNAGAELGTKNENTGSGSTSRRESIRTKISAKVIEIDEAGNLIVEGTRKTKVNGEEQTIKISGTVRPVDILPNNSVYSYNILNLTLLIEGEGTVSNVQEPGLITKFLRILF